jgi:ornithine--oxo-acid transaminase
MHTMTKQSLTSEDHFALLEQYCAPNYAPLHVVLASGHGCWLTDVEGKRYLDMHAAYSGINFGHSNERLLKVAHQQLDTLTLTSRAFVTDNLGLFCKELAEFCGMEMTLPMNSGAEAVETSIKLARRWGYERKKVELNKAEVICFNDNFHGRTTTIISFSDAASSRTGYGPFTEGFPLVPYGDIEATRRAITKNTVAILVEPIQGEAGIIMPPEGFLRDLRALCTEHNILLMADEIQTGFCRTGARFACDHEQVRPDVYILGKSLGGGIVPISAVVASRELLSVFTPGTHGSTFSGNPFACAIAREVLRLIDEEKPELNSKSQGDYLLQRLEAAQFEKVEAVRGRGLFIGVDIKHEFGKAKRICEALKDKGILCKDTRDYSIRIAPPLCVTRDEIDQALSVLSTVL